MKSAMRQALFDKLMEGVREQTKSDEIGRRLFEASTNEDLDKIEPLILSMLADRDVELRTKMDCGHPIVLMELAPFAEQPKVPSANPGFFVVDANKLIYHCSACEREKRFVRVLVEHVRKRMPAAAAIEETDVLAAGRAAQA
jgi:hypothetical protein